MLAGTVLAAVAAVGALAQEGSSPLRNGDLRALTLLSPPGTRVEYFRLDLPAPGSDAALAGEEEADPVGVVRWIAGPDVEDGVEIGRRFETEAAFFDVDTRVILTESLRPEERKLVYREVRERGGRTVLLEWSLDGGPRATEVIGGRACRREIDTGRGVLLPLYLIELVRAGASIQGPFPVFSPLAGDVEMLELEVRRADTSGDSAEVDPGDRRELRIRRSGALSAGRYVFEGEHLVRFQWQAGGVVARPLTEEAYHAWIRRHRTDRGH